MNKQFYITTAIPYVNAKPHVGHALEFVQGDVIARYHKTIGNDVFFSLGSDENSLKNVRAAEIEKISTQQLVDKYAEAFKSVHASLNIKSDTFNKTSQEHHFKGAQKLWLSCKKEDVYKKSYEGLYCVGCEEFYTQDELIDGKCPDHKVEPEKISEENYFFKLSNYQNRLEKIIENNTLTIIPLTRKNEVMAFIKQGLQDFSISRSVARAKGWGVPVPHDPNQIMYVWFDALTTYLTSLGYGSDEALFNKYWSSETEKIHIIGKGIIRFHAIYWIAMLLSANILLPDVEFVHGYITINGQKISKSLGNVIDPIEMVEKYGADTLRYYLLKEIPPSGDGDFSERRLKEVYNADLANGLGNLVARVARLAEKNEIDVVKEKLSYDQKVEKYLNEFKFNEALTVIWSKVAEADKHINETKPWTLSGRQAKQALEKLSKNICEIAFNLQPFLPETAEKILIQFSGKIKSSAPLFPRLT